MDKWDVFEKEIEEMKKDQNFLSLMDLYNIGMACERAHLDLVGVQLHDQCIVISALDSDGFHATYSVGVPGVNTSPATFEEHVFNNLQA